MVRPVLIISHRRSGTHFLWESLRLNFKLSMRYGSNNELIYFKSHTPFSESALGGFSKNRTCIYLIRDARDTLVSSYYYWKAGREPQIGVNDLFQELSFSQYLRGGAVEAGKKLYGEDFKLPELFSDPIRHWMSYTEWSNKVFTVRFEDLKSDYEKCIVDIGNYIGRKVAGGKVKYLDKLVGQVPRKGEVGDWKNHFSKEDLDHFWSIAGDKMLKLGYAKEESALPEPKIVTVEKPEGLFSRLTKRITRWFK